jgi:hypothetical protein
MPVMGALLGTGTGPFEEPRQLGEHGRGLTLGGRRLAQRVDHPAEPAGRRPHRAGNRGDERPAAPSHAFQRRERHQQGIGAGKADHLAGNILGLGLDHTIRAPTDMACSGPETSTIKPRTPTTRP